MNSNIDQILRTNITQSELSHIEFLDSASKSSLKPTALLSGCRSLADYIRQGPDYSTDNVSTMFDQAFETQGTCSKTNMTKAFDAVVEPRKAAIERARADMCGLSKVLEFEDQCMSAEYCQ